MGNQSSPAFVSGKLEIILWIMWNIDLLTFNSVAVLLLSYSVRNRRSAQGDRLSAITMALQYESDEEGILSGTSAPRYLHQTYTWIHQALMKWLCLYWWVFLYWLIFAYYSQVLSIMTRGNLRRRAWPLTWTWLIPSSSCMRPCEVPGTARASWSLSLSCSCPPGRTTPTTSTRSISPSASIRSSRIKLCVLSCLCLQRPESFNTQQHSSLSASFPPIAVSPPESQITEF